ncbi:MAG: trigger factor, partial [Solobacterium sp.]|nr:trigger factor [Solobacterium sp.]
METVEGEAADGDTVNIDYEGFSDGVPFERGKEEGRDLVLGSGTFVPGFEEQLIGVKAGDEKEINVTFPEDYASEELAGKPVVFKVKVNEVKRKVVPALDDDFAKDVSVPGVETVEDLRRTVRERLEASRKEAAEREADTALLALLRENCEIDLPQVMIENEAMAMVKQTESQIMQYGMDPAQYLKMMGQTEETLAKSYMEDAEKAVRTRLALKAIIKAENIEVTDEEIDAELKELATQLNMDLDAVKKAVDLELVRDDLAGRKALEFLKENAAKN